jgi:ubiquitin-conjugating enzyme E2 R
MLRKNPDKYKQTVRENVNASKLDIPEGFVMPTHESTMKAAAEASHAEKMDDHDFWVDSDAGEDYGDDDDDVFGGSDSDADMALDDDGTEDEDEDDDGVDSI